MQFDFLTASKILFGSGRLSSIGNLSREFGTTILVIHNGPDEIMETVVNYLEKAELNYFVRRVQNEPTVDNIQSFVDQARENSINLLIGIGGGSAIDSAKATAALVNNTGPIIDYLEVIGHSKPVQPPPLPIIAIPTTAGTGAEVTKNAVIGSSQQHVKVSLRSTFLLPRIALIDPQLTLNLPQQITAFSGLDALTQLIESYTCNVPNSMTDLFCGEGIKRIKNSFYRAYDAGNDISAREDMSFASLLSGISLTNAKLGAVHGLAGPLGGELNAPHGAICACLLPHVIRVNLEALSSRSPKNTAIKRYYEIGNILTGEPSAHADAGTKWIEDFCIHTHIPGLSSYGLNVDQFPSIIEKAIKSSSMKGNPITLFESELRSILNDAL